MPFFSKRKSGKQKSKVGKHGSGQESSKAQTNSSQRLKQQDIGQKQNFNGVRTTPDIPRKELFKTGQRSQNSTAKCVANFPRRSRLSKSLPEVLVDDSILPLLLEYLHRQAAQNILNFWLAAETFRLSSRDKNLFPYKSKLKLKADPKLTNNTTVFNIQHDSMHGVAMFQLEKNDQSSDINMIEHDTSQSPNSSRTNEDDDFKSENSGLRTEDIKTMNLPGSAPGPMIMSHSKTASENSSDNAAILTSAERTTENKPLCDSNQPNASTDCSDSHLIYSSTNSNITLPSHDENFARSRLISPVSAGDYSTSSEPSVSPLSSVGNSLMKNSNFVSSNRSESSNSKCSELFQIELQSKEKINFIGENKNELSNYRKLHASAAEVLQPQRKDELLRQESNDRRERRRMSKIIMDDAVSIYRHFISLDASQPLGVDEDTRREVESKICTENGLIDPECFNVAQKFAFATLQNRYFDDFVRSSYYQKHIMDILTSGKVFLADIMYNDSAIFYFMEFMEQEEKSYLLAFWFAVDSFCQELQSKLDKKEYNADEALDDAMVLYDKYFSMQASNSLGVSDETRIRIENKICREGGPLPECFEEPMENVLTLLEEVYFPIFLDSSVYFKYLNELFSSVTDVDSDQISYADDCSSTASGSETLKLMESLVNDVEAHEDPDEIWQRPQFGLSIGRVNEFGIYEPGIEPQPGKEALKFGQKMKKLVSGDSEKVKEEMAWKVAKMVLEDVKKQQGKPKSR